MQKALPVELRSMKVCWKKKCVCYDFNYLIGLMKTFFVEYLKATNYTIFILVCRALSLINIRHTCGVPVRGNGLSIKVS